MQCYHGFKRFVFYFISLYFEGGNVSSSDYCYGVTNGLMECCILSKDLFAAFVFTFG